MGIPHVYKLISHVHESNYSHLIWFFDKEQAEFRRNFSIKDNDALNQLFEHAREYNFYVDFQMAFDSVALRASFCYGNYVETVKEAIDGHKPVHLGLVRIPTESDLGSVIRSSRVASRPCSINRTGIGTRVNGGHPTQTSRMT